MATVRAADAIPTASTAKQNLKRLIIEHSGDADHPEVKKALDDLIQVAETEKERGGEEGAQWSPTDDMAKNQGRWRAILSPFPGRLPMQEDGKLRYKLGRMSFGMFSPTKLICAVDSIINIVEPISDDEIKVEEKPQVKDGESSAWEQTYNNDVLLDIETLDGKLLPAIMSNHGVCSPKSPTRLGVKFSQGTLKPRFDVSSTDNAELADLWKDTFDCAIEKDAQERTYVAQLGTWAMHGMMKMMMGLEPPIDTSDFTQTYMVKRPHIGYLDILYLDDDFRVTRGNRGTVVVVERVKDEDKK